MVIFFRRIARGVGGFVRRAAPVLRSVARVAAPVAGVAAAVLLARRYARAWPEDTGHDGQATPEREQPS